MSQDFYHNTAGVFISIPEQNNNFGVIIVVAS
jgi:hypothetical protein